MFVSAGDLEKYAYCPLSWWLSREHKTTSAEGVRRDKEIKNEILEIKEKEEKIKLYNLITTFFSVSASIVAILGIIFLYSKLEMVWLYLFLIISLLWLFNSSLFFYKSLKTIDAIRPYYEKIVLISSIIAIIVALFAIFFFFPKNENFSRFLEILALFWIISANIFFYRTLAFSEKIIEKKIKYMPLKGEIVYVGKDKPSEELISKNYGIRGTPDYIIKIDDDYIPIEEKSCILNYPLLHHVIQLMAYCIIVEENYGKTPYGILRYTGKEFKIPYEERWKNRVIDYVNAMKRDIERNEAHRNHNKKIKCSNCLRREWCPEKLD
ncbi:MAG: Dna2/Cas4 domain-containing protein [Thermoplasmatales archaeon]|nr:Dna2/Cas4 domain-containing protein [Thermoplasmatales archaeon]